MPKPYPSEFRDAVVRDARNREPGVRIEQIANDIGVHPNDAAEVDASRRHGTGAKPGQSRTESARLLEQENEVLRRCGVSVAGEPAGERLYPLVTGLADARIPVRVTCRVLKLARQPYYRWLGAPSRPAR